MKKRALATLLILTVLASVLTVMQIPTAATASFTVANFLKTENDYVPSTDAALNVALNAAVSYGEAASVSPDNVNDGQAGDNGWVYEKNNWYADSSRAWFQLTLDNTYEIDTFELYSRFSAEGSSNKGVGIPANFKIEVQLADDSWITVVDYSETAYANTDPGAHAAHCFVLSQGVSAKAVKFTALSFNDAYPLWVSEMVVLKAASFTTSLKTENDYVPETDASKNVALNAAVSYGEAASVSPDNVNDGQAGDNGWVYEKNNWNADSSRAWFQLTLDNTYEIDTIELYSRFSGESGTNTGVGIPKKFKIEAQLEDDSWVTIVDYSYRHYPNTDPGAHAGHCFTLKEAVKAKAVKFTALSFNDAYPLWVSEMVILRSAASMTTTTTTEATTTTTTTEEVTTTTEAPTTTTTAASVSEDEYEFEASLKTEDAYVPETDPAKNLALNGTVTAGEGYAVSENRYGPDLVNDGQAGDNGWIYEKGNWDADSSRAWVQIDLEQVSTINSIELYSRYSGENGTNTGVGIPEHFIIEVQKADDTWVTVVDYRNAAYANADPGAHAGHCFTLKDSIKGKAVKFTALSFNDNYPLWVSEMVILGSAADGETATTTATPDATTTTVMDATTTTGAAMKEDYTVSTSLKTEEEYVPETDVSKNLALNATVTAGEGYADSEDRYGIAKLNDGQAGDNGWIYEKAKWDEDSSRAWFQLTLDGVYNINTFELYSRQSSEGTSTNPGVGIPEHFTIEVQKTDGTWVTVVDYSEDPYENADPGSHAGHCFTLDKSIEGKAVKFTALSYNNNYPIWVSEMVILGSEVESETSPSTGVVFPTAVLMIVLLAATAMMLTRKRATVK